MRLSRLIPARLRESTGLLHLLITDEPTAAAALERMLGGEHG